MTRLCYIICFLVFGIVSNVFCQTKDPNIVRNEELAEIDKLLRGIRYNQCLLSIFNAKNEIEQYAGKIGLSSDDVERQFNGFFENLIVEKPMDVSVFPSTPGGHVVACDGELAAKIVSFSNEVVREAEDYAIQQLLRELNVS